MPSDTGKCRAIIAAVGAARIRSARTGKRPGRQPRPVVDFPEPLFTIWDEPDSFGAALKLHASRHGETIYHLYDVIVRPEDGVNRSTLISWGRGAKLPRAAISLEILGRAERRYRLPAGYFASKAGTRDLAPDDFNLDGVTAAERRRLAWHLPDAFNHRSRHEQAEILDWVRNVIISGSTDYQRYQAAMMRQRYAVRFSLDYIKAEKRREGFARACPDFVVVDEAHACVGTGGGKQLRFDLLAGLAKDLERRMILLTATPHSGDEEAFARLLSLIDPSFGSVAFDSEDYRKRLARHFVQRRRIDLISDEWSEDRAFPKHETTEMNYRLSESHLAFQEAVLDYCFGILSRAGDGIRERRLAFWGTLALMRCVGSQSAASPVSQQRCP